MRNNDGAINNDHDGLPSAIAKGLGRAKLFGSIVRGDIMADGFGIRVGARRVAIGRQIFSPITAASARARKSSSLMFGPSCRIARSSEEPVGMKPEQRR